LFAFALFNVLSVRYDEKQGHKNMEFQDTTTRRIARQAHAIATFTAAAGLCLMPFYIVAKHMGVLQ